MSQQQYKLPSVLHCNMQAEQKQLGMNLQMSSAATNIVAAMKEQGEAEQGERQQGQITPQGQGQRGTGTARR